MNKNKLKQELDKLGIDENYYSLEGELIPDRTVLYQSYHEWQVFYFDERGNKDQIKVFNSEEDACKYIYEQLKEEKEIENKYLK